MPNGTSGGVGGGGDASSYPIGIVALVIVG